MNKSAGKLSDVVRREAGKRLEVYERELGPNADPALTALVNHFHTNALAVTLTEIQADARLVWPNDDERLKASILRRWMDRYHAKFSFLQPEECSSGFIGGIHAEVFAGGENDDLQDFLISNIVYTSSNGKDL